MARAKHACATCGRDAAFRVLPRDRAFKAKDVCGDHLAGAIPHGGSVAEVRRLA